MHKLTKFIPAWLACAIASLLLHSVGGLGWLSVLPFALLSFIGATLIVRSQPAQRI